MEFPAAYHFLRAHLQARVQLTDDGFADFRPYLRPLRLNKRQHLLQAGEPCTHLAFVNQGCLRSYSLNAQGQEHTLQFAPEDWWVSDMYSLLTQLGLSSKNGQCAKEGWLSGLVQIDGASGSRGQSGGGRG